MYSRPVRRIRDRIIFTYYTTLYILMLVMDQHFWHNIQNESEIRNVVVVRWDVCKLWRMSKCILLCLSFTSYCFHFHSLKCLHSISPFCLNVQNWTRWHYFFCYCSCVCVPCSHRTHMNTFHDKVSISTVASFYSVWLHIWRSDTYIYLQ